MRIDFNKLSENDKKTFTMWRNRIIGVYAVLIVILVALVVDTGLNQPATDDGRKLSQVSASSSK